MALDPHVTAKLLVQPGGERVEQCAVQVAAGLVSGKLRRGHIAA